QQQRAARGQAIGELGHQVRRVGEQRRRAAREAVGDERRFVRTGHPRVGAQRVDAERRRRLQTAGPRVVLKQQRAAAARRIERVLVQQREEIVCLEAVGQQRGQRSLGGVSWHSLEGG